MKRLIMSICLLLCAAWAHADTAIWHRDSNVEYNRPLTGLAQTDKGYYLFNGTKYNATAFVPNGSWNVNDFTDAGIPADAAHQVTLAAVHPGGGGYGSWSYAMGNGRAAYFMNSYSGTPNEAGLPMVNSDMKQDSAFGGQVDNIVNNWALGPNAKVCLSTHYKNNNYYGEWDKAIQSYWAIFIRDAATGRFIHVTVKLWANRNEGFGEGTGDSEVGPYAYTYVGPGSTYITKWDASDTAVIGEAQTASTMNLPRWYHACITRANLQTVINKINTFPGIAPVSTNPDNYQFWSVTNQTEMMKLHWIDGVGYYYPGTTTMGPYNPNARSMIGVTWWDHAVVTLY